MKIGEQIRAYREVKGYTTKQLGLKAHVSQSIISNIENDNVSPTVLTLSKILEALDVSLADFFESAGLSPAIVKLISNSKSLNENQIEKINELIEAFKS
ncbi:helix-turn-helix domain-containing protein [Aneurinibacillus aneurinilyticus]|jgi:transcriptional regulator with XRE-family HTH domain|uniref:helix-turn-helix domain-containing protein n=1 Tax=Aneurinibacillus aneurinilyticus TaxID=1391 RepID=UPI0023F43AA0|nr:helix-turn-helix transcriptional regulator [Aneurinibacillus aneurinilyticus]